MALNAKHVYAPTPDQSEATGAVAVAPEGTDMPTTATETLSSTWDNGGYVDENGITITLNRSTTPIRDWSKGVVRNILTEFSGSISVNFLQVDQFSTERVFGANNVSVAAATATTGEQVTVSIGAELPPIEAWCFSMKDGEAKIRVCVPRGQIAEVGEMAYKPDAGHVIGGTLQCYNDESGKSIYVIYDDGEVISGGNEDTNI